MELELFASMILISRYFTIRSPSNRGHDLSPFCWLICTRGVGMKDFRMPVHRSSWQPRKETEKNNGVAGNQERKQKKTKKKKTSLSQCCPPNLVFTGPIGCPKMQEKTERQRWEARAENVVLNRKNITKIF